LTVGDNFYGNVSASARSMFMAAATVYHGKIDPAFAGPARVVEA
jgi:hypothetical protein